MQIAKAGAGHTERKCNYSRREHGTQRGNADSASESKAQGEEMHMFRRKNTWRGNADSASGSRAL